MSDFPKGAILVSKFGNLRCRVMEELGELRAVSVIDFYKKPPADIDWKYKFSHWTTPEKLSQEWRVEETGE